MEYGVCSKMPYLGGKIKATTSMASGWWEIHCALFIVLSLISIIGIGDFAATVII